MALLELLATDREEDGRRRVESRRRSRAAARRAGPGSPSRRGSRPRSTTVIPGGDGERFHRPALDRMRDRMEVRGEMPRGPAIERPHRPEGRSAHVRVRPTLIRV